jgi:hypothetical protein
LLDTGASVNIIRSNYFNESVSPFIDVAANDAWARRFNITGVDSTSVDISHYLEMDIALCGTVIKNCPFLVMQEMPCTKKKQPKSEPVIIGMSAVNLAREQYLAQHDESTLTEVTCPEGVNKELFTLLAFTQGMGESTGSAHTVTATTLADVKRKSRYLEKIITVGMGRETTLIPAKSAVVKMGHLPRKVRGRFMIHSEDMEGLPPGLVINNTTVRIHNRSKVEVLIMNTSDEDICWEGQQPVAQLTAC